MRAFFCPRHQETMDFGKSFGVFHPEDGGLGDREAESREAGKLLLSLMAKVSQNTPIMSCSRLGEAYDQIESL